VDLFLVSTQQGGEAKGFVTHYTLVSETHHVTNPSH
jgi:hypothetical protein